jgi:hypothetical protein
MLFPQSNMYKLWPSFNGITMATIVTLSHKTQNLSTANNRYTMPTVITRTFINITDFT